MGLLEGLMGTVHLGFRTYLLASRILWIGDPHAAPIRRRLRRAMEEGKVIDSTGGRRLQGVILTTEGYFILSAMGPKTLALRVREVLSRPER